MLVAFLAVIAGSGGGIPGTLLLLGVLVVSYSLGRIEQQLIYHEVLLKARAEKRESESEEP